MTTNEKNIGIYIEGCEDMYVGENHICGYEIGLLAKDSKKLKVELNEIGIGLDEKSDLIDEIVERISTEFQQIKKQNENTTGDKLLSFLSNTASDIISDVIVKSLKL